ncbi:MAG: MBL fold metallo-hydrolase [Micrococcus sp.]|nr:MBL fold metallo-hydrolase [Micrococcus sp.]
MHSTETPITLPADLVWVTRPFPNSNMLLLRGERPTAVDTGFAAHAEQTASLIHEHLPRVQRVVNTHWHSDHVGGNRLLQTQGAEIVASAVDAEALDRRDPGCCVAEYLEQPVPAYTVDTSVSHADTVHLGDRQWQVHAVPGHAVGHIALYEPEQRLLMVGDTLTSYDVGWVNVMLDGMAGVEAALDSVTRLAELDVRVILPGHGPIITDAPAVLAKARERLTRQCADLPFAVDYGVRRALAYQLMISGGRPADTLEQYVASTSWARDAAALLGEDVAEFAARLVRSSLDSGAFRREGSLVLASLEHETADPEVFRLPWPRDWEPVAPPEPAEAAES